MNGGQALLALMKRDLHEDSSPWLRRLTEWSLWLCVALALSWLVAIGFFVVRGL